MFPLKPAPWVLRQQPHGQQEPSTAANPSSHITGKRCSLADTLETPRCRISSRQTPPGDSRQWLWRIGNEASTVPTKSAHLEWAKSPCCPVHAPLLDYTRRLLGVAREETPWKQQENPLGSRLLTPSMSEGIRDLSNFTKFAHTHWVRNFIISCYYYILLYSPTKPNLKIGRSCREARRTGWVLFALHRSLAALSLLTAVLHIIPVAPTVISKLDNPVASPASEPSLGCELQGRISFLIYNLMFRRMTGIPTGQLSFPFYYLILKILMASLLVLSCQ